jgi:DNA repair protein RadD
VGDPKAQVCPHCKSVISAGYATCPDCGEEIRKKALATHESSAANTGILSSEVTTRTVPVQSVLHLVHHKKNADENSPLTMRVQYQVSLTEFHSEWVCFEHTGFARRKAEEWWGKRSAAPCPETAVDAVTLARAGVLAPTLEITLQERPGERFPRVVRATLGDIPAVNPDNCDEDGDESFNTDSFEDAPF